MSTIEANLWIESDFLHPDVISETLGCQPTDKEYKGALTKNGKRELGKYYWSIDFGEFEQSQVSLFKKSVIEFVSHRREELLHISKQGGNVVYITLLIRKSEYHFGFVLTFEEMAILAGAGIALDVNVSR